MLIEEFLPRYDVVERHHTIVRASPREVFDAVWSADLAGAFPVRVLLALRALPAWFARGRRFDDSLRSFRDHVTLRDFERVGFSVLGQDPPREIVVGLVGRFWTMDGGLCVTDAEAFRQHREPGTARAAWNFFITDLGDGRARLSTETRVQAVDDAARRVFRRYWLLVRPGSGLIRRYMLRAIRQEAERLSDPRG